MFPDSLTIILAKNVANDKQPVYITFQDGSTQGIQTQKTDVVKLNHLV